MADKKITTDQLAKMVKKSFDSVDKKLEHLATKEQIKNLEKRFDLVDEKLKESNKLETRVDYIGNVLAIKK